MCSLIAVCLTFILTRYRNDPAAGSSRLVLLSCLRGNLPRDNLKPVPDRGGDGVGHPRRRTTKPGRQMRTRIATRCHGRATASCDCSSTRCTSVSPSSNWLPARLQRDQPLHLVPGQTHRLSATGKTPRQGCGNGCSSRSTASLAEGPLGALTR